MMKKKWLPRYITVLGLLIFGFRGLAAGGAQQGPATQDTPSPQQSAAPQQNATAYYVKATGSNDNDGLTAATPFKSLRKALDEMGKNRSIRTIIVIGTLDDYSEGATRPGIPVFRISCREGFTDLTIKGKPNANEEDKAVLSSTIGTGVVGIQGVQVRFEDITITGGRGMAGGGIAVMVGSYQDALRFAPNGDIINGSSRKIHWFDASVTLGPGAVVTGNQSASNGGGVVVIMPDNEEASEFKSASLLIDGGIVENNEARGVGGGVFVAANAGFSLKSGEIRNNTAFQGGGLFIAYSANNNAMDGGNIFGNNAAGGGVENLGGGVVINGGTFTMNGGAIRENNAGLGGGGLYIGGASTTFRVVNGSISDNSAVIGGGMMILGATVSMRAGSISGNSVSDKGGGIAITERGAFTIQGGSINGNRSDKQGGGVYVVTGSTIRQAGGQITGNSQGTGQDIYRE
jgi:hypothetical protein